MPGGSSIIKQSDLNEALKLEKRKQFEEERRKRIFNANQRLHGLDLDTLERQIAEKVKQRQTEAECERRYVEQVEKLQTILKVKELELEKRRRLVETDLNYYRCRYQRKEQRREFDLNDSNRTKPVRIGNDDSSLGISSAQVFDGEDLGFKQRKQRQQNQQRAWLDQQVTERKQAIESRLKADKALQESLNSRDKRFEDMANSERRVRNEIVGSIRQYNCDLAKKKREERLRKKKETNEDDLVEINNMLTSDMLTENPDVAQSRTNPNKKIAIMFRGMNAEELAKFRQEQQYQMIERRKQKTEQQLMDKQWEQYALNIDRELILKQLEVERNKKEELRKILAFNANLAKEQKIQKDYNNKIMNVNHVSPEFYDQFNKTTR